MNTETVVKNEGMVETVKVDRTKEKIALIKELGLKLVLASLKDKDLRFKPISTVEITRKLRMSPRCWNLSECTCMGLTIGALSGFIAGVILEVVLHYLKIVHPGGLPLISMPILGALLGGTIGSFSNPLHRAFTDSKPFQNWAFDLPYGALLAVKEAKRAGVKSFRIHYLTNKPDWVNSDPVITGVTRSGQTVEIFSWYDGKVYDS